MARLGDVCIQITDGSHNPPMGIEKSNHLMLSSKNIDDDRITFNDPRYLSQQDFEAENKRTNIEPGDLLMTIVGTIGRVAIVPDNLTGICVQRSVAVLKPKPETVYNRFLMYYLQNMCPYLEQESRGVAQKGIYLKQLNNLTVILPPLDEQRKIAAVLDKVSDLIAKRRQQLNKLDEMVKCRFIEMFGDISETVPLSYYIARLSAGKSLAGEEECPNKVLKTGAATYDYFDPTQVKSLPADYEPQEDHRVNTGDVIISRMNTAELVGAAAYVWEAPEYTYLPDRLWRAEIKETACPVFVWQMLIQSSTKESIRRIASGTSGSMKNISKPGLLGIRVQKVPLTLQEQFANFVEQTNKSKSAIQKSLEKLETLKKALMQEYFG